MNTLKMITEIKSTCANLESEKNALMVRVREIDDRLTAYKMAIDSLELTIPDNREVVDRKEDKPIGEVPGKYGRRTVLEYNGKSKTLSEWAQDLNMTPDGILYRLNNGWSINDALTCNRQPGKCNRKKQVSKSKKVFVYDAHGNVIRQYVGVGDAARNLNLPASTIEKIISQMPKDDQLRVRNYYLAYAS